MNFDCNVKVVDMIMGSGKTSAAINLINETDEGTKFLFITPYLEEIERIKEKCPEKNFKDPQPRGTKLRDLKLLISKGENIVSTHALFRKFDKELIDLCRVSNYTLIMDEVTDVVEKYEITKEDFQLLKSEFIDIDEETGLIKWRDDKQDYYGKFSEEKRLCDLNCLSYYGGNIMMWLFPVDAFNAFRNIYILTYMFSAQIQRYYYDYYNLPYSYTYVEGTNSSDFNFTENCVETNCKYDFKSLIHILEEEKLNAIGDRQYDLSKSWYLRNKNNVVLKQLKNNIKNFFTHKRKSRTSENLWTTFTDFKKNLSGDGYGRAFVPLNMRASNKYKERTSVAYPVNRYLNTGVKNFFVNHNVEVDEDGFALSEMLQFIWRSAIREGHEIWVYIPSIRMRELLKEWLENNSIER